VTAPGAGGPAGQGNAFMTGYVLYSLYIAQRRGHQIQAECVKNGLKAGEDYF